MGVMPFPPFRTQNAPNTYCSYEINCGAMFGGSQVVKSLVPHCLAAHGYRNHLLRNVWRHAGAQTRSCAVFCGIMCWNTSGRLACQTKLEPVDLKIFEFIGL